MEVVLVCDERYCLSAPRARQVLETVAAACPQVRCRIADEADRPWIRALGLMITPAFVLNGQTAYVGVPTQEELLRLIAEEQDDLGKMREAG